MADGSGGRRQSGRQDSPGGIHTPPEVQRLLRTTTLPLESAGIGTFVWHWDTGMADLSPAAQAILDCPDPQLHWPAFRASHIHPDDLALVSQPLRDGTALSAVYRVQQRDGSWRTVRGMLVPDQAGGRQSLGVLVDLSRVVAPGANPQEDFFRRAVEAAGIGTWRSQPDGRGGRHRWWSPQARRLFGSTIGSAIEQGTLTGNVHPDDREQVVAWRNRMAESGAFEECTVRVLQEDGTYRWRLLRGSGRDGILSGVVMDVDSAVTARRELEAFSGIFELASQASLLRPWVWDLGTDRIFVPAGLTARGLAEVPPEGRLMDEHIVLLGALDPAALRANQAQARQTGAVSYEFQTDTGDWILVRGSRVADPVTGNAQIVGYATNITDRKRAELENQRLRTELEAILEATGVGIWHDIGGGQASLSPGAQVLLGVSEPVLSWSTLTRERLHPDDLDQFLTLANLPPADRPGSLEFRVRQPDGSWRWIRSATARGLPGREDPTGVLVDIHAEETARVQAERSLAELDLVLESTGTGTWTSEPFLDPETVAYQWSPGMYQLFGVAPGTRVTRGLVDSLVHPDDRPNLRRWAEELRATGDLLSIDVRVRATDGSWTWRSLWSRYTTPGRMGGQFRGVAIDRHEAIEAQERLLQAGAHLRLANEIARMRPWVWDLETGTIAAPGYFDVPGTPDLGPDAIPVEDLANQVDVDDPQPIQDAMTTALETGELDLIYQSRNGEWVLSRGRVMPDPLTGRKVMVGCAINITDQRLATEEAERLRRDLEQVLAATDVGIWEQDPGDPKALVLSPSAARLLGTPVRVDAETMARDVLHPDDVSVVAGALAQADAGQPVGTIEFRVRRPDGTWRWLRSVLAQDGTGPQSRGVLVDIDRERQAVTRAEASLADLDFVLATTGVGVWTSEEYSGRNETVYQWSDTMYTLFGVEPGTTITRPVLDTIIHPDDVERLNAWGVALRTATESDTIEIRIRDASGGWRWRSMTGRFIASPSGPGRYRGVATDVDHAVQLRNQVQEALSMLRRAAEAASMMAWSYDPAMDIISGLNLGLIPQLPEEIEGMPLDDIAHTSLGNLDGTSHAVLAALRRGQGVDAELPMDDGRWQLVRGRPAPAADGEGPRVVGLSLDVTERRRSEARALAMERRFRSTLDALDLGAAMVDRDGRLTYVNPALLAWLHGEEAAFLGRDFAEALLPASIRHRSQTALQAWLDGSGPPPATRGFLRGQDGSVRYVEWNLYPLRDDGDTITGASIIGRDATAERHALLQLQRRQHQDSLTGLVTRGALERAMRARLRQVDTPGGVAVIVVDMDRTALINELGGYGAGDRAIQSVAATLRSLFRDEVVARLGGDEFAVLVSGQSTATVMERAEELRRAIGTLRVDVGAGPPVIPRASIGVAISQGAEPGENLLTYAERACLMAKTAGRNRVERYDPDPEAGAALTSAAILALTQEAIGRDQLLIRYQPILDLVTGQYSVEVLTRILDRDGNIIPPAVFVEVAEQGGIVAELDRAIFTHALEEARAAGFPERGIVCDVNASHFTLRDPGFVGWLRALLERLDYPADQVVIEVTETATVANLPALTTTLHGLRAMGIRIALDDFGVGLSSFALLAELPIDVVKIDGSFVRDVARNPVHHAMIKAIVDVARAAGKDTIAEFVEDEDILGVLRGLGVGAVQGYVLSQPVPLASLDLGEATPPRR